jgi:hypothetical protein
MDTAALVLENKNEPALAIPFSGTEIETLGNKLSNQPKPQAVGSSRTVVDKVG